jgi:hypothetical protein
MDLGEVGWGDVDWIGLAKDRNRWRALVSVAINLRVQTILGSSRVTTEPMASRVVLTFIHLII